MQLHARTQKHLKITKNLKQYFSVVGKRLNIMSFTIKVLQAYCIALHYLFPLPLVLIPCFQSFKPTSHISTNNKKKWITADFIISLNFGWNEDLCSAVYFACFRKLHMKGPCLRRKKKEPQNSHWSLLHNHPILVPSLSKSMFCHSPWQPMWQKVPFGVKAWRTTF